MYPILIAILLVIATVSPYCSADTNRSSIATGRNTEFECPDYSDDISICAPDCQTIITCAERQLVNTFKCSDLSTQFPYCIPNTFGCTSHFDPAYETCTFVVERPEFICTSDGYFPDPDDCTAYFICSAEVPYKYQCPPNYVFDASQIACKLKEVDADCVTVQCTTTNEYVVHTGNRQFYGFCSVVDCTAQIIMFRCTNPNGHIFNPKTLKCEFECTAEGRFPSDESCQQYYQCYRAGDTDGFVKQVILCPNNYMFDPTAQMCVLGTC